MCIKWRKCCCCVSLEVGTQIISVLAIISNVLWMCYLSYTFVQLHAQAQQPPGVNTTSVGTPGVNATSVGTPGVNATGVDTTSVVMAGVQSALVVLNLVFAIVLAVGAFKNRPSLLWPWMVMAWVSAVVTLVTHLVAVVAAYSQQRVLWLHGAEMLLATLYALTVTYLSCVVGARRRQLVREYYACPVRLARTDSYERRVFVPVTSYQYTD